MQIFGSCVVLPEPVSPDTMTTWWSRMARDLVAALTHRQVREGDHRDCRGALGELLRREGIEGARVLALGAVALAAPVVSACPASSLLPCLASALVASAAPAVAPVGGATRVARTRAARVGLGRRCGARVRHDSASLVAGQRRTPLGTRWRETTGQSNVSI